MANRLKRKFALAGISARCFTVDDMEFIEQFKTTKKYREWKDSREIKRKKISKKKGKDKAYEETYGDFTPSYNKLRQVCKPRLRL